MATKVKSVNIESMSKEEKQQLLMELFHDADKATLQSIAPELKKKQKDIDDGVRNECINDIKTKVKALSVVLNDYRSIELKDNPDKIDGVSVWDYVINTLGLNSDAEKNKNKQELKKFISDNIDKVDPGTYSQKEFRKVIGMEKAALKIRGVLGADLFTQLVKDNKVEIINRTKNNLPTKRIDKIIIN